MRILIIEDDQEILKFLQISLKRAGFTVETAVDGERGSFLARTNSYDSIIIDYNLPKLNGLEACQEIRQDGINTPILVLTVHSEIDDKLNFFNSGADDYLSKPFAFSELLARLKALNRRPREIKPSQINIGDIEINADTFTVTVKNKKIYLSTKEFALLNYLANHTECTLSREAIRTQIWGEDSDFFSNTVETHISKLRRQIKDSRVKIKNIPNRGYRLELKS